MSNLISDYISSFKNIDDKDKEVILEVDYPFSVKCMDAGHDFGVTMMEEIKKYVKEKLDINIDEIYLLTSLLSQLKENPISVKFDSSTHLKVFKKDGKNIVLVILSASVKRK
jgi:hypothetical protein